MIVLFLLPKQWSHSIPNGRLINFETQMVTYYTLATMLPNVAPEAQRPEEKHDDFEKPSVAVAHKAQQEVHIRPQDAHMRDLIIQQPNVEEAKTLPKLPLPNILMQAAKSEPGVEPISVTPQINRDLRQAQLNIDSNSLQIDDPLPMTAVSQTAGLRQSGLDLSAYSARSVQRDLPVEPSQASPQLSQMPRALESPRGQTDALRVPPPVDSPMTDYRVSGLQSPTSDLLVYSAVPSGDTGQVAVPRVSLKGRLLTSPTISPRPLPVGAAALVNAEVVIPSVSIQGSKLPSSATTPALVQVPSLPKPPPPAPIKAPKAEPSPPFAQLPSGITDYRGSVTESSEGSPLQEYERTGGIVYTAAINAPNFTSKQGSWIFRFAELQQEVKPEPPTLTAEKVPGVSAGGRMLSPPSATIKVDPKYPPEIIRERIQGNVILFAIIRKEGSVDPVSIRVIRRLDPRLDINAREALLRWRFKPSMKDGIAVDIQTEVTIPFYYRLAEP